MNKLKFKFEPLLLFVVSLIFILSVISFFVYYIVLIHGKSSVNAEDIGTENNYTKNHDGITELINNQKRLWVFPNKEEKEKFDILKDKMIIVHGISRENLKDKYNEEFIYKGKLYLSDREFLLDKIETAQDYRLYSIDLETEETEIVKDKNVYSKYEKFISQ